MCSRSSNKSIGFLCTLTLTISHVNCCKMTSPVVTIKSNIIESYKLLNVPCFASLKFKTWLWTLLYKLMYVNKNAFYVYFVESGEAGALSIERFSCAMLSLWSVSSDTAFFLLDIQSFFNIEVLAWGANGHQFFAPLCLWFLNKLYFQFILLFSLKLIYIIDMSTTGFWYFPVQSAIYWLFAPFGICSLHETYHPWNCGWSRTFGLHRWSCSTHCHVYSTLVQSSA